MTASSAKTKTSASPVKRVRRSSRMQARRTFSKLVTRIRVKPQQHKEIIIGSCMDIQPPKGFSIELSPSTMPVEAVTTEVTTIGTPERYSYALRINNSSHKVVSAEIWQM